MPFENAFWRCQSKGPNNDRVGIIVNEAKDTAELLALRVRKYLCRHVQTGTSITYQALAKALDLTPPNTIYQLTVALECLIEQDAAACRPLIAALVISKARGGLPAPGFFDCAQRVGRFQGNPLGPETDQFYAQELEQAIAFWRASPL